MSPAKRRKKTKKSTGIWKLVAFLLLCIAGFFYYFTHEPANYDNIRKPNNHELTKLRRVEKNYGEFIDQLAPQFKISPAYLKALIALECSGLYPPKTRLEKHVLRQLKRVRDKEINSYGSITYDIIGDASDGALENLATSWGPFQLMGYQCIELDVLVKDIRGKNSVYWGIYWINKRYGKWLDRGDYKSGFHIHNTGRPFPRDGKSRTYDKHYIEKGLVYMRYFDL